MPSDQRVRPHDSEDATPLDQVRQSDEGDPRRVVGTPWLHLPLQVQRKLLPQEQILGGELGMRPRCLRNKPHNVTGETQDRAYGRGDRDRAMDAGSYASHGNRECARRKSVARISAEIWPRGLFADDRGDYLRTTTNAYGVFSSHN